MVRLYEYDGSLFPHPIDDPEYCEKSHECGEPCMCQIGTLKGEYPDVVQGIEIMKLLGASGHFIFHYYDSKIGRSEYDIGLARDMFKLLLYSHFEKDEPLVMP